MSYEDNIRRKIATKNGNAVAAARKKIGKKLGKVSDKQDERAYAKLKKHSPTIQHSWRVGIKNPFDN